jgi:hypothetical protein
VDTEQEKDELAIKEHQRNKIFLLITTKMG